MTRDDAQAILDEYLKKENLRKHCRAHEACMRFYAKKFGEDEEKWGIVGLLHDFDYEIHPTLDQHPRDGAPILRARGVPEDIIRAILAHGEHPDLPRETRMEKASFAIDELTGLIVAAALVQPNKTLKDVTPESVLRKFKDRHFAAGVNRENIREGARLLNVSLEEHITNCLRAMQEIHNELGL